MDKLLNERRKILIKKDTRFILCINEDFDSIYIKDLSLEEGRLSQEACVSIARNNLREIMKLANSLEDAVEEEKRLLAKENARNHLRVVK